MRRRIMASLLSGLMLLGLTGCELITVNRAKDKAQVVAKIGDVSITKGELYDALQADFSSQGYDVKLWDESMESTMRSQVDGYLKTYLDDYVNNKLISTICEKDYPLTDDEKKEIDANTATYLSYIKQTLGYDEANPSAFTGDIEKAVDDYLATMGTTREKLAQMQKENFEFTKVKNAMMKDVQATEEQVQTKYNADLQAQKQAFATDSSSYETSITTGSMGDYTLFKPNGYAVVKHILLTFSDADKKAYENANTAVSDAQKDYSDVQTKYNTAKSNVDTAQKAIADAQTALTAAQQSGDQTLIAQYQKTISDNNETVKAQTSEMNTQAALLVKMNDALKGAQGKLDALKKTLLKHQQATIDTIMQKLKGGETFDKLMAQYNKDKDENGADNAAMPGLGYVISPNNSTYEAAFASAALAMTARGQTSDPVMTAYGVHILYMVYTPQESVDIPYDAVKGVVKKKADETAVSDAWKAKLTELRKQYGVQTWPSRVTYVHEQINK